MAFADEKTISVKQVYIAVFTSKYFWKKSD